ncbi:putative ABC transporter-associated repeat protein [Actinomyces bovis]|uniref:ABC transporter-associated repeat protein n=1 Tax=Actinomyces bovis TaxID=1658 RepID=A0ABY1VKF2_9ACTO|nr:choice-of-anchor M domain-containing protein [Actinomyces bovis]SPT52571.1 putative ABC transporter-associated repeat protein [Actinomyces bovis]VEG54354.1 putative ABC transporter-associated repeat protein [Actinomyces israelii]
MPLSLSPARLAPPIARPPARLMRLVAAIFTFALALVGTPGLTAPAYAAEPAVVDSGRVDLFRLTADDASPAALSTTTVHTTERGESQLDPGSTIFKLPATGPKVNPFGIKDVEKGYFLGGDRDDLSTFSIGWDGSKLSPRFGRIISQVESVRGPVGAHVYVHGLNEDYEPEPLLAAPAPADPGKPVYELGTGMALSALAAQPTAARWLFTMPGTYHVRLAHQAVSADGVKTAPSPAVTYTFQVGTEATAEDQLAETTTPPPGATPPQEHGKNPSQPTPHKPEEGNTPQPQPTPTPSPKAPETPAPKQPQDPATLSVAVSDTPAVGHPATITAKGFTPGAAVELLIDTELLATVTATPEGATTAWTPTAAQAGERTITARSGSRSVATKVTVAAAKAPQDDSSKKPQTPEGPQPGAPTPAPSPSPKAEDASQCLPAGVKTVLDHGHIDMLNLSSDAAGSLSLQLKETVTKPGQAVLHDPATVLMQIKEAALGELPEASRSAVPGLPARGYILDQSGQDQDTLIWPGWDTTEAALGGYGAATFDVSWTGPKEASIHAFLTSLGKAESVLTDGGYELKAAGSTISQPTPAHKHVNWVFSHSGRYTLRVTAHAKKADGTSQATLQRVYHLDVGKVPCDGHMTDPGQAGGSQNQAPATKAPAKPEQGQQNGATSSTGTSGSTGGSAAGNPAGLVGHNAGSYGSHSGAGLARAAVCLPTIVTREATAEEAKALGASAGTNAATPSAGASAAPAGSSVAGQDVWMIPASQISGVPWLGLNSQHESVVNGSSGEVVYTLTSVDGPGNVAVFMSGKLGSGVGAHVFDKVGDSYTLPKNTHAHPNWVFTAPGTYKVGLEMSVTPSSGSTITTPKASTTLSFVVGPGASGDATDGHFDLGPVAESGALVARVKDDRKQPATWVDPTTLTFALGDAAKLKAPEELSFISAAASAKSGSATGNSGLQVTGEKGPNGRPMIKETVGRTPDGKACNLASTGVSTPSLLGASLVAVSAGVVLAALRRRRDRAQA